MVKQLSVTFLFAAAYMLSGAEKNLIRNGSFEQWNNAKNLPVAWSGSVIKDKNIFKQTADAAADGKHSIVWTDSRQSSLNQWVSVKGGKYYRFSCKAKYNINPWYVMFRVSWRGKGKVLPGAQMRLRNGIQNDWTEIVIDNLRAPEGATTAVIEMGPYACHQKKKIISKSIYVDDVKFVEFTPAKSELRNLASIPLFNKKLNCIADGKADESFWSTAATVDNFLSPGNLMVAKLKSTVKLAADKENIYVFAKLYSPKINNKKQPMEERDQVVYSGDFFEIFFDPAKNPADTMREHYQIMLKPSGILYDQKAKWLGKVEKDSRGLMVRFFNDWNCDDLKYKTEAFNGYWTAEFVIPVKSLGISKLKTGDEWYANFNRSIYDTKEYTSWQPLVAAQFHDRTKWGKIRFASLPVTVSDLSVSPAKGETAVATVETAMLLSNHTNKAKEVKITLYDWNRTGTRLMLGTPRKVKLAPKVTNMPVALKTPAGKELYIAEIAENGKTFQTISCKPFQYFAAIRTYDPKNVLGNKLYLASGMRSFKPFFMESNFPGKEKWGIHRTRRNIKAIDLICDLPQGVEAVTYDVSGWGEYHPPVKPVPGKKTKKNGVVYQEYIFKLPCISPSVYTNVMFFNTNWKPGQKGMAYLKLRWAEGEQVANAMPIEVLDIPKVPRMKTYVRWDYITPEFAYQWFDKPAEGLLYNGINTFPLSAIAGDKFRPTGKTRLAVFDRIVKELDQKNFYYCLQEGWDLHAWNWTNAKTGDPDACYKNINGKNVMTQWSYPTFCQLYRGKWYQKWVNRLAKSPAIQRYGCTWLILDMEFWGDPDGCFCDRCLKTYPAWCKERKYATGGDPKKFMADRNNNKKAVAQWQEFNLWRFAKLFQDVRDDVMKGLPAKNTRWTGPFAKPMVSEWRKPNFTIKNAVDVFEAPFYYEPEIVREQSAVFAPKLGEKYENLGFALAPAPTWPQNQNMKPADLIYNFFEGAALRAKGYEIYSVQHMEMRNLQVMNQALRVLAIIEDIYLDGKLKYPISCTGKNTHAQAVVKETEAIVYVRNYLLKSPEKTKVTMPLSGTVYDCRTHKKLGKAEAGKPFEVTLAPDAQGRMLYIGTDSKFANRVKILN